MERIRHNFFIDKNELNALKRICDREGETVSFHIRQAIREYTKKHLKGKI